jgi:hypothetical protein
MAAKRKTAAQAQETTPETSTAAARERQPGDEPAEPKRSFAPDPFAIAIDAAAGVRLAESRRNRQLQLSFDDKPPQAVTELVKEHGFRWNGQEKHWTLPLRGPSAYQDRVDGERLFQEVAKTLREAKGHGQEKTPF